MTLAGVRGVARSKKVFTTKPDPAQAKPRDLVKRGFTAPAPNRLWVANITSVATGEGFAYVAFVVDVFSRMIVGWNVAATLKADVLPLLALNMAVQRDWVARRARASRRPRLELSVDRLHGPDRRARRDTPDRDRRRLG
ncbi:DDE-type integrase/transposase/recombinase [Gulosibacter sediminis]|uniref:DDE-type integrase/transposase/recombinase n=1 Tax=Gulosibacter sediminis TaxID=1729695 RepID=UPI0039A6AADF